MDATMRVQTQIRQNAEEVSASLAKLVNWEKSIIKKDKEILSRKLGKEAKLSVPSAVRKGAGTVATTALTLQPPVQPQDSTSAVLLSHQGRSPQDKADSSARHTYNVGYRKWEEFDVDAALADEQSDEPVTPSEQAETPPSDPGFKQDYTANVTKSSLSSMTLNPTSLAAPLALSAEEASKRQRLIPAARGVANTADAEAAERELGNAAFAAGNFAAAVKSYTKCLGLKSGNYVAFSNRAMAYLKLKEWTRAESDATSALRIAPTHSKSLLRRAAARTALGKHRAALQDLLCAQQEEPSNNATRGEVQRAKEALLSAVNRAPMLRLEPVLLVDDFDHDLADGLGGQGQKQAVLVGPDLPL